MKLLACAILVLGFLVFWQAWPVDDDFIAACPPVEEGQGYAIDVVWWPPGAQRCTVTDGSTKTTYPWREYLAIVLVAASVAVLRLRLSRILASLGLLLAAFLVFFGFV